MKHFNYVGNNDYIEQYLTKKYNDFTDMFIIFWFMSWLYSLYLCYVMIKKTRNNNNLLNIIKGDNKKEVIIVRGVPGVGKNTYVYTEEKNTNNIFTIVSNDQFFTTNNDYIFSRKDITKAENCCFNKYYNNLILGINKIYVTNVNNEKWMYENYIKLANTYGYHVRFVELYCSDKDTLFYFNKRSSKNVPLTYSKNVYKNWEQDNRFIYVEPYIGNYYKRLQGDSLPYPKTTFPNLNKELDDYMNRSNIENTDENTDEIKYKKINSSINYISLNDINKIYNNRFVFSLSFNNSIYVKLDYNIELIKINNYVKI